MKAKKILVCSLGGTICSRVESDKVIRLNDSVDKTIFERLNVKANLSFFSPVFYSSENASISLYKEAFKGIIEEVQNVDPDSVLILHGTDSMAHFAQLAVRTLAFLNVPIIITGSKYPPDDLRCDAKKNLKFAFNLLDALMEGGAGGSMIGVVFNDSFMGESTFIPAQLVMDADEKGDMKRYSGSKDVDVMTEEEAIKFVSSEDEIKLLTIPDIPSYPIDAIDISKIDACLLEGYHSGTQDYDRFKDFIKSMIGAGKKVYISPVTDNINSYESEKNLIDSGIIPIENAPFLGAWALIVSQML